MITNIISKKGDLMIKSVLPLSLIIALRFFGLFIVLSVLSGYAKDLPGGSAFLAGIALGGYALTQAVLQVPFGVLSDRIGRKKTLEMIQEQPEKFLRRFGLLAMLAGVILLYVVNVF